MSSTPTMPTICQFVVFHYFDNGVDKIVDRPAVITSIPSKSGADHYVNLHVFFEPHDIDRDASQYELAHHHRSMIPAGHADPLRPPSAWTWSWPP